MRVWDARGVSKRVKGADRKQDVRYFAQSCAGDRGAEGCAKEMDRRPCAKGWDCPVRLLHDVARAVCCAGRGFAHFDWGCGCWRHKRVVGYAVSDFVQSRRVCVEASRGELHRQYRRDDGCGASLSVCGAGAVFEGRGCGLL